MKRLVPIVAALVLLPSCEARPEPEPPTVDNVWIRLPAVSGHPGAAYFTILGGAEPVRLKSVRTPAARRVELHESRMEGGMTQMAPLREPAIGPRERVKFEPRGRHAMLFEISRHTSINQQPTFVFRFSDGTVVTKEAYVLAANDPPPRFVPTDNSGAPCRPDVTRTFFEVKITNCGR